MHKPCQYFSVTCVVQLFIFQLMLQLTPHFSVTVNSDHIVQMEDFKGSQYPHGRDPTTKIYPPDLRRPSMSSTSLAEAQIEPVISKGMQ